MSGHFNDKWGIHNTSEFGAALAAVGRMRDIVADAVLTTRSVADIYRRVNTAEYELACDLGVPQDVMNSWIMQAKHDRTSPVVRSGGEDAT